MVHFDINLFDISFSLPGCYHGTERDAYDNCNPCALNTYKFYFGNEMCSECPMNTVTKAEGSRSVFDCGKISNDFWPSLAMVNSIQKR